MAAVWGIDIGKAALKAVKLRRTKEGLEIVAIDHIAYPVEDDEDERQEHVNAAVRNFLTKHKLGADQVVVAIPGLHAFSRFIKLPPVDKSKIGMMVRMEAQQQIPFPIAEVNWDFLKTEREYEPGEEIEVGIFATRSELIDGFLGDLRENQLTPDVVTIAPLAVYNFVRYNSEDEPGATVILDIGAEHTDLVIIDGERFWIRNLRIAGNDITKALAERFKIPFAEAEKLKKSSSKSQQAKKIFGAMEPVLKDLVGEVHRSVGFFKSQADDLNIKRMVLMGDGAKLKSLSKFLQEQLKYEVNRVQRLEQDKFIIDPEVDLDVLKNHLLGFGVALGLAIQGVKAATCAINLAPEQLKVQSKLRGKLPFAAATAVCAWAAVGLSWLYWTNNTKALAETNKSTNAITDYEAIQTTAQGVQAEIPPLMQQADGLLALGQGRTLVLELMDRLRVVLPSENAKIPTLTAAERKQDKQQQIAVYVDRLAKEKTFEQPNKIWLLDMNVGKRDAPAGQTLYRVRMRVAKRLALGEQPANVREEIKNRFVQPLVNQLLEKPFHVRNGDTIPPKYGDINVGVPKEIYALHPDQITEPPRGGFHCVMVELTFEVGVPEQKTAEGE